MSLDGLIPFCSTFGAFMSSRAKDQARVNDINDTNVKMVATHCGLSVGEDGPTHQAIDDMSSFLGILNTGVIEPADANQTDRIIRYVAGHYGNFYVRMGRHKFPVITKEDGSVFYGADYQYTYGRTDVVREGSDITIAATGPMVLMAIIARDELKKILPKVSIEIVSVSSIKKFDQNIVDSVRKTGKLITVEDHNSTVGLSSQLTKHLVEADINLKAFHAMGVSAYQLSGTAEELYRAAGISHENIVEAVQKMLGAC
jgi:transketolase